MLISRADHIQTQTYPRAYSFQYKYMSLIQVNKISKMYITRASDHGEGGPVIWKD